MMLSVRRAKSGDIESIAALWKEMMHFHIKLDSVYRIKPDAENMFRDYALAGMNDPQRLILVCCKNEEVTGYAFACICELPPVYIDSRVGEVDSICVAAEHRRSGAARKLVKECEAWFKDNGITRAECMVSVNNPLAKAFWKSSGYTGYNQKCYKMLYSEQNKDQAKLY